MHTVLVALVVRIRAPSGTARKSLALRAVAQSTLSAVFIAVQIRAPARAEAATQILHEATVTVLAARVATKTRARRATALR
jgi:hypothetical protein